jgi:hypothetical protein
MPRSAPRASNEPPVICQQVAALIGSAMQFVARDRGEALIRKWLSRFEMPAMAEGRLAALTADATLLAADLLMSYPSASGTTAFDRLARSRAGAPAAEQAAMTALRSARFRLLQVERCAGRTTVAARDAVSGETLQILDADLPPGALGAVLFARVAILGDAACCLPGAITPLDPPAFAVARNHPAAGAPGAMAQARWAEAVYEHVVRHGTVAEPGFDRLAAGEKGVAELVDDEIYGLATAWAALADAAPDRDLLQRSRFSTNLSNVLDVLAGAVAARERRAEKLATGFARLLQVQLETIAHRERSGAGRLGLDDIARSVDEVIATGGLPRTARELFASVRRRAAGNSTLRGGDNPALTALVQRIRALRAKTVAQGCTEQEALAAAEKAAELLDRYGLSLSELEFRAQPCDGIGIETKRRRFAPIDTCVPMIAAYFDCRAWVEQVPGQTLRYVFFGLRGDVAAAQYMYDLVERAFQTETEAFRASELYVCMVGERRSATNSFQVGLGRGICSKLARMQAERANNRRSASGRDLVPVKAAMVEEELARLGLDLHTRELGRGRRVLAEAYAAGEAAGQRFEFRPAISEAA